MKIITKKDIEELIRNNKRSLDLGRNTIVTSMAKEFIEKNHIRLNYIETYTENSVEGIDPNDTSVKSEVLDLPLP